MRTNLSRPYAMVAVLALAACQSAPTTEGNESYLQLENGALLHYRKVGSGPEVLVVPGESWFAEDLAWLADGRTVIFYDGRGRGRSDVYPAVRFEQDVSDLEEVRQWFGLDRIRLVGIHYQAAVAAEYAAQHPEHVERLVLVSPIPARKFPYWAVFEKVLNDRLGDDVSGVLRQLRREGLPSKDPEKWAETYRSTLFSALVVEPSSLKRMKGTPFVAPNLSPERVTQQYLRILEALGEWDWRGALSRVACPTGIVYGDSDPMPAASTEEWAASIEGAEIRVIERSGRLPWVERPDEFRAAVDGFLDSPH